MRSHSYLCGCCWSADRDYAHTRTGGRVSMATTLCGTVGDGSSNPWGLYTCLFISVTHTHSLTLTKLTQIHTLRNSQHGWDSKPRDMKSYHTYTHREKITATAVVHWAFTPTAFLLCNRKYSDLWVLAWAILFIMDKLKSYYKHHLIYMNRGIWPADKQCCFSIIDIVYYYSWHEKANLSFDI